MQPKTKLLLTLTVLTFATLACATLTDGAPLDQPAPPAALPTNTPLPPPPTSTPIPLVEYISPAMIMGGEVLFFDDFSDPSSGWDRFSNDEGITDYENGIYKIGVLTDTKFFWANPYLNFGDQIIDVQATVMSTETDNQYGIVCRHQNVDNWYALVISSDGFASIRKRYQGSDLEYIADWVEVPAINLADSANNLHAECIGSRLALFVNDTLAIEIIDADIPTGDAGLLAGTFEATSIEVLFDNFQVSAP